MTVTIDKYVDGSQATAEGTDSSSFPMMSSWTADNIGAGSGTYALGPTGFNSDNAYEAVTADMSSGASYSTNEDTTGGTVAASCDSGKPYSLVGYTTGDTMEAAASAEPSLTPPALTDITTNKYVIVWNHKCEIVTPPTATSTVRVIIRKYVDNQMATASSSKNLSFPMSATWNSTNYPAGTGTYALDMNGSSGTSGSTTPYEASTVAFDSGADYSTYEITTGSNVAASCSAGKPFALAGYGTGDSWEAAQSASTTMTAPAFTNITSDKYVIVKNVTCSTGGGIGGDVVGPDGTLAVTSVDAIDTTATADNTYENGWKYVFHITMPSSEPHLAMKFADWINGSNASSTIPAGGNMRLSSAQSDNASTTIPITAANTYSTPDFNMTGDLDPVAPGRQVQVTVEVKIPVGTANGSYTTNYGVRSNP